MLNWPYYTLNAQGYLEDEDGYKVLFSTQHTNGPDFIQFRSAADAQQYLEENDIRGTVR